MTQTYKLKKFRAGKAGAEGKYMYDAYQLTVPSFLARRLRADQEFTVEVTDEGILYRPAEQAEPPELPAWVTNGHPEPDPVEVETEPKLTEAVAQ